MTAPKHRSFTPPDGYVTVQQAAAMLGISVSGVKNRIHDGHIPDSKMVGSRRVIPTETVASLIPPNGDLTVSEAARCLGIENTKVVGGLCVRGVFKHAYKRVNKWYIPLSDLEVYEHRFAFQAVPSTIEIDGEEYISAREVQRRTGEPFFTIESRMKRGGYRSARQDRGMWFAAADEVASEYVRLPQLPDAQEVDGVLYMSVPEAAVVMGVTEGTIHERIHDGITFKDHQKIEGHDYVAVDEVYDNCQPDALSHEGRAPHPIAIPRVRDGENGEFLLSMPEVALRLGVKVPTVHDRRKRGLYPSAEYIRKHWYINESDLYNGQGL